MNHRLIETRTVALFIVVTAFMLVASFPVDAQRGGAAAAAARDAAAIDLTGYWVSVITEDWKFRMVTPAPGMVEPLPLTAEGRRIANEWDPARDEAAGEACRAYGAAAIMRTPGRLNITWEDANTLRIDTDAGNQTRLFRFGAAPVPSGERTWQGHSIAEWEYAPARGGQPRGNLKVVTTNMRPGYVRKNGIPYGENAVLTEYYIVNTMPNGDEWLTVTTILEDAQHFSRPYITSSDFKKLPDNSGWNPTPCSAT